MNLKILLGICVLIVGLVAAIIGIADVDRPDDVRNAPAITGAQNPPTPGDQNEPVRRDAASMVLPVIAGLAVASGAALIGIGMGHFRNPRIIPPDSPQAEKAATTRGTTS
jgi:hypothetical protein